MIEVKADRCPYPRPFREDFAECPSYEPMNFDATDSRNKPLGSWPTCRHLTTGNDVENRGRFYPRCALGSPEQRLQNQLRELVQLRSVPPKTTAGPA
ncbi:MAG: hypothetical protein E6I99_15155 [Chloroflexi bacterium]|nr:MAG: hypothetical protein E6I99_15155 [Chloroflexota bacterium]